MWTRATDAGSGKRVWGQHTKSDKLTTNLDEGRMPSGDFLILKWKIKEVMNGRKFGDKGDSGSFLYMKRNRKVWSLESLKWKIKVMEESSVTREIQYDHSST